MHFPVGICGETPLTPALFPQERGEGAQLTRARKLERCLNFDPDQRPRGAGLLNAANNSEEVDGVDLWQG